MFEAAAIIAADPREFYAELVRQAEGLLAGERDWIANAANLSSDLYVAAGPELGRFLLSQRRHLGAGTLPGKTRLCAHRHGPGRLRRRCRAAPHFTDRRCERVSRSYRLRFRLALRIGRAVDRGRQSAGCAGFG